MGTAERPAGLTELGAINRCLRAIGDTPVNSLPTDDNDVSDVALIRQELLDVTREVCEDGAYFNCETEYAFEPDSNGEIILPVTLANWTQSLTSHKTTTTAGSLVRGDLVERYQDGDRKLYDKADQTYVFSNTVYLDVYWYMPFDEIPNPYRKYIAAEAGLRFLVPNDGDQNTIAKMDRERAQAMIDMQKAEILQSGPAMEHSYQVRGGSSVSNYYGNGNSLRWGF